MLVAGAIANKDREIQTEVRDVGEWPAGIERERSEHGEDGLFEVAGGALELRVREVLVVVNEDAVLVQLGDERFEAAVGFGEQLLDFAADGDELGAGAHAVGTD